MPRKAIKAEHIDFRIKTQAITQLLKRNGATGNCTAGNGKITHRNSRPSTIP